MAQEFQSVRKNSALFPHTKTLTHLLHGGEERYNSLQQFRALREKHDILKDYSRAELSRKELFSYGYKRTFQKMMPALEESKQEISTYPAESYYDGSAHAIGSIGMMMTNRLIELTATDEQKSKWLDKCKTGAFISSYSQTELSHGSDVQTLKTVAVFDEKTKDFVVHTPSLDAIKWWPGDLGVASTHTCLFARLICHGKDHGVQPFFFEIRDPVTHKAKPGIEIGDIGPKMGYDSKDNGFIRLTKVHIPLNSLLGKYVNVDEEGNVHKQGNQKILYAGMMAARTTILSSSATCLLRSSLIATRYSFVRKQFKNPEGKEIPIFSYQLQKQKILTEIAKAYASCLSTSQVIKMVRDNDRRVLENSDFSRLQTVHVTLCEHKAMLTEWASYGMINLIRACGGHGFSIFSGIPWAYTTHFPEMILEGENSVLYLQVSRALLKALRRISKGKGVGEQFQYLRHDFSDFEFRAVKEEFYDVEKLIGVFEKSCSFHLIGLGQGMMEMIGEAINPLDVWNFKLGIEITKIGKLHSFIKVVKNFKKSFENVKIPVVKNTLNDLLRLVLIDAVGNEASLLLEAGAISKYHMEILQEVKEEIFERIAPHALVLVEAADIRDEILGSALGHSNGKPYENLFKMAKEFGTLNQFENSVHPAMKSYLDWRKKAGIAEQRDKL